MFKALCKLIKKDFKAIDRYQYEEGYNYAAGELLKNGFLAVKALNDFVESEQDFGRATPFEDGVLNAISDYQKLIIGYVPLENV